MKKQILILFLLIVPQLYSQKNTDIQQEISILFIGNSLTYTNNLPQHVSELAKKRKNINIKTTVIAKPNYSLEDHWKEEKIQNLIQKNNFDYIIVQQGPSSQKAGKKMLLTFGKKLQQLCEKQNSKLCFYMVWPSVLYYYTFDNVIKNYSYAAKQTNAVLLPVGSSWKKYIEKNKNYDLYGPDRFHPSKKGTQFAAKIIVETLFE